MTDVLGYRLKVGVVTPSVNTVVQPEYDEMRPVGVTNHIARIYIKNYATAVDSTLDEGVPALDRELDDAVKRVLSCEPDVVVLGVSIEAIYGSPNAGEAIEARLRERFGQSVRVVEAGRAIPAGLHALGIDSGPIGLLTPYGPAGESHLAAFVTANGYELGAIRHLSSPSLLQIAHTPASVVRAAFEELAETRPRAIVQFGANLAAGRAAAEAEAALGIPVIAVNTATYWHALRTSGIEDQVEGFGGLFSAC